MMCFLFFCSFFLASFFVVKRCPFVKKTFKYWNLWEECTYCRIHCLTTFWGKRKHFLTWVRIDAKCTRSGGGGGVTPSIVSQGRSRPPHSTTYKKNHEYLFEQSTTLCLEITATLDIKSTGILMAYCYKAVRGNDTATIVGQSIVYRPRPITQVCLWI